MSCGGRRMVGWSLQGFPPSLSPELDRQNAPRKHPKLNLRGLHRCDFQRRAIWLAAATVTFTLWFSTLSSLPLGFGIWFKLSSSPLQVFFFFFFFFLSPEWETVLCLMRWMSFFSSFHFVTQGGGINLTWIHGKRLLCFGQGCFLMFHQFMENVLFAEVHPKKDFHRNFLLLWGCADTAQGT